MSYSLRIVVTGGHAVIDAASGQLPDGMICISGHEDEQNASIGITRYTTTAGRVVVQASGYAAKS